MEGGGGPGPAGWRVIVPGTGYSCGVITPESPCQINGVVSPGNQHGGLANIGGFVYRGDEFPALVGKYVYGDLDRGNGTGGRVLWTDRVVRACRTCATGEKDEKERKAAHDCSLGGSYHD